jgi:hypothetical protein
VADFASSPTRPINLVGSERRDDAVEDPQQLGTKRPSKKKAQIEMDVELEQDSHHLDERA